MHNAVFNPLDPPLLGEDKRIGGHPRPRQRPLTVRGTPVCAAIPSAGGNPCAAHQMTPFSRSRTRSSGDKPSSPVDLSVVLTQEGGAAPDVAGRLREGRHRAAGRSACAELVVLYLGPGVPGLQVGVTHDVLRGVAGIEDDAASPRRSW